MTKALAYYSVAAMSALLVDQMTKYWALANDLASINSGIAFGIFAGFGLVSWIAPLVFLSLAGIWMKRYIALYPITIGLFFGAAISNVVDRWRYDGVVDWLQVPILGLQNNLADWVIVGTLAVLTVRIIISQKKVTTSI